MAQRCEHLHDGQAGEVIETAGIVLEVCVVCQRELSHRLDEMRLPETPIEIYARERESEQ
jgi:hypothetical protein